MDGRDEAPIACALQPGGYQQRLAWIADVARDGPVGVSRQDLRLELRYPPSVADRVRDMVGKEQECFRLSLRPARAACSRGSLAFTVWATALAAVIVAGAWISIGFQTHRAHGLITPVRRSGAGSAKLAKQSANEVRNEGPAIYAGKSTDESSATTERKSLAQQGAHAPAHAVRKGWTVGDAFCSEGPYAFRDVLSTAFGEWKAT